VCTTVTGEYLAAYVGPRARPSRTRETPGSPG
jgi:hypothetical protein